MSRKKVTLSRPAISIAMAQSGGSLGGAARRLGVSRQTLMRRIADLRDPVAEALERERCEQLAREAIAIYQALDPKTLPVSQLIKLLERYGQDHGWGLRLARPEAVGSRELVKLAKKASYLKS